MNEWISFQSFVKMAESKMAAFKMAAIIKLISEQVKYFVQMVWVNKWWEPI